MRLDTDWFLEDPIDFEHKQYILFDYISKVQEDLDNFQLYPCFQEVSLHVANMSKVIDKKKYITLKRYPEEIDDEILMSDLIFNNIPEKYNKDWGEIKKIAIFAREKFTDLFLIAKSVWSLIYDAVNIEIVKNEDIIAKKKPGAGYFFLIYNDEFYLYFYNLRRIHPKVLENKCEIELKYKGPVDDYNKLIWEHGGEETDEKSTKEEKLARRPVFRIYYSKKYPLEGAILSLARRKIMNHIFQTIKIDEIREKKDY